MEDKSQQDITTIAESMIQQGQYYEAKELLEELVLDIPPNWKSITKLPDSIEIAYWDMTEFIQHVRHYQSTNEIEKRLVWVTPSYSKMYYLLAFIAVERKDWTNAMNYVDKGLTLEPDHPLLLCEKAMIFLHMNRQTEAYNLFMKAIDIRTWAPPEQSARAMRGAAVALIDLKRLDEAEEMLKKSLELEPDNEVAKNELGYIENLRKGGMPNDEYYLLWGTLLTRLN